MEGPSVALFVPSEYQYFKSTLLEFDTGLFVPSLRKLPCSSCRRGDLEIGWPVKPANQTVRYRHHLLGDVLGLFLKLPWSIFIHNMWLSARLCWVFELWVR